jgi:anthranilate phosphoribosyltransferase
VADCIAMAENLIDSGQALAKLEQFRRLTNEAQS